MNLIKAFSISLMLLMTSLGFAQMHHHPSADHASVHGMLVVGKSHIYLSHLPMFHSPHDYQVIFEAQFSEAGQKTYLNSQAQSDETVYTLVPEAFVLPDMVQHPRVFTAQLYRGHFERGGSLIASNVQVEIKNVIYFKKFNPVESQPSTASYLLFGNGDEQFLAHQIFAAPDFDQVSKVSVAAEAVSLLQSKQVLHLQFREHANQTPLNVSTKLLAMDESSKASFEVSLQRIYYFETGDLAD
jgi:hypothetical protein